MNERTGRQDQCLLVKILEKQFKEMGGQLLLKTPVRKILRSSTGEIKGVLASTPDEKELRIDTAV